MPHRWSFFFIITTEGVLAGGKNRPSISKKQKERKRQERKQAKTDRLARRKSLKERSAPIGGSEDPDLAGIVPGPQPLPWEQ